jgi:hypothetical protein
MFRIKFLFPKLTPKDKEFVLLEGKNWVSYDYHWSKQQGSDGLSGYQDRSSSDWSNSRFSFEGIVAISFPRCGEPGR